MNKLKPNSIKFLKGLVGDYGANESKIVEHLIESENPLETFLKEVQFYKPNEKFIGQVLLYVGDNLNLHLKNTT